MKNHEKSTSHGQAETQHHHGDIRQRLKHLILPDSNKKVFVASSPHEAELVRRLSKSGKEESVECLVHGSDEHLGVLRSIHAHHEGRKQRLREQHGPLFDELEATLKHVDALKSELDHATRHTDGLDGNFQKFGYSNAIRTHDVVTPAHPLQPLQHEWTAEQWQAERFKTLDMRFYMTPILRQYEHKGILWRANLPSEVYSYELFIDLLYVGIMGISGDAASEGADGHTLLRFVVTFLMGWIIWSELTLFMSRFWEEDVLRRLTVLFHLSCLIGFTVNIRGFYGETYTPLVAFFVASGLARALMHAFCAIIIPTIRACCVFHAIISLLASILWIGSIFVKNTASRQTLIWVALYIDILGYETVRFTGKFMGYIGCFRQWLQKNFAFVPGINIEHRVERTGSFTTLVFGYSIIALLFQSNVSQPFTAFLGKAVLALLQVFAISAIYFAMDGHNIYTHAIRRHTVAALIWTYAHLPMTMAFILSGSALSKLVTAHDCRNANPEGLWEIYISASEEELTRAQRWFYCAGLGVTMLCTAIIAMTHVYKTNETRPLGKSIRLALRCMISIAIILLALTNLDSMVLISVTCILTHVALFTEIIGNMLLHHSSGCSPRSWSDIQQTLSNAFRHVVLSRHHVHHTYHFKGHQYKNSGKDLQPTHTDVSATSVVPPLDDEGNLRGRP